MPTLLENDREVRIPESVRDYESFRDWIHSEDFPEKTQIHFIHNRVWIDPEIEELYSHNFVKSILTEVLNRFIREAGIGIYVCDGMYFSNDGEELVTVPDAMFVSNEALDSGTVSLRQGKSGKSQGTELHGVPELVVEILSRTTRLKDTDWLFETYWKCGIAEYWMIDARDGKAELDIYRWTDAGYVAVRKSAGWIKSPVLGKAFQFNRTDSVPTRPQFAVPQFELKYR